MHKEEWISAGPILRNNLRHACDLVILILMNCLPQISGAERRFTG